MRLTKSDPGPGDASIVRLVVAFAASATALLVAGSAVPALLEASGRGGAEWIRAAAATLCHGIPSRCFAPLGAPFALCARCTGLYLGGAAGLLAAAVGIRVVRRGRGALLLAAVLPTAIDVAAPWVGGSGLPNLPRFFVAAPVGVVAGLLLAEGIEDAIRMTRSRGGATIGPDPVPNLLPRPLDGGRTGGGEVR